MPRFDMTNMRPSLVIVGCAEIPSPGSKYSSVFPVLRSATNSPALACDLRPNTDYYINVIQSDPVYDPDPLFDEPASPGSRG